MEKTCYYIFACAILLVTFQIPGLAKRSTSLATDQSSLYALKTYITSDPYRILTRNWTNSSSVCSWIGITCNLRHRRVAALNISNMSLSGTIPPQLGNLSFLVFLDFTHNFFSGTLPRELSLLYRLKFVSLKVNNFRGEIPSWFGLLPKLEYLSLRNNSFRGYIPKSLSNMSNVQHVDFSFNYLSGDIPSAIYNIPTLETIAFASNELSGSLPIDMCNNRSRLEEIQLSQNQLSGQIPSSISQCSQLEVLSLFDNSFSGQIPSAIGMLKSLQILNFGANNLTGVLPREIGQLYQLEELELENNGFTGSIPLGLFNISTLRILSLYSNGLSGALPTSMCYGSPLLEELILNGNNLSGTIPDSISNCSNLRLLSLASNKFTGFVPWYLGNLRLLEKLQLQQNNLRTESSSSEMTFITSLTSCRFLTELSLYNNPLDGIIPASIGNLSSSLQTFRANNCKLRGSIPIDIGNLSNLVALSFYYNELTGNIPLSVKYLHKLQGLDLESNNVGGPVPESLCGLQSLSTMALGENQFSGSIPECLGNVSSLRHLHLDSNMLTSSIPSSLWRLENLLVLNLSSNLLSGPLSSDMGNMVPAIFINLSMNQLSGTIPSTIGNLLDLVNLFLAHNRLEGSIPVSVGTMISLTILDFSYNNLSGSIPKSLEALQYLDYFNVSFNRLSEEIPSGGPFKNFTMESFKGNEALCGMQRFHVPLCYAPSNRRSARKKVQFSLFILAGVIALITAVSLAFIFLRYKRKDKATNGIDVLVSTVPERISYYEILQATEHFNESNLLGTGSFGSVYKGILRDGRTFAVKVFNLHREAAFRSFDVECEALRNIRHRNLTKVISSCSNEDFKALVLEYMPNGNLEKWLYSHNYCLDVMQRLNIMIDVASALEYLHHGYSTAIVHCDLKPSNVLLDEEMIAHVNDFGIAKLLVDGESIVLTNTLATLGYIAPEYGLEGVVSTRCDVYSYGVMLMETFTRKRPSDDMFAGDLSLKSWVESSLAQSSHQVIDASLLMNLTEPNFEKNLQCVSSILKLALKCSAESPRERINMKEALAELQKIKHQFCR